MAATHSDISLVLIMKMIINQISESKWNTHWQTRGTILSRWSSRSNSYWTIGSQSHWSTRDPRRARRTRGPWRTMWTLENKSENDYIDNSVVLLMMKKETHTRILSRSGNPEPSMSTNVYKKHKMQWKFLCIKSYEVKEKCVEPGLTRRSPVPGPGGPGGPGGPLGPGWPSPRSPWKDFKAWIITHIKPCVVF